MRGARDEPSQRQPRNPLRRLRGALARAASMSAAGHSEPSMPREDITRIFRVSLRSLLGASLCIGAVAAGSGDWKALIGAACVAFSTPLLLWALGRGLPRVAMTGAVAVLL